VSNGPNCSHTWVANSGQGGKPVYNLNLDGAFTMRVTCPRCLGRAWFTPEEWDATRAPREESEER
jgi:hypothetical protein